MLRCVLTFFSTMNLDSRSFVSILIGHRILTCAAVLLVPPRMTSGTFASLRLRASEDLIDCFVFCRLPPRSSSLSDMHSERDFGGICHTAVLPSQQEREVERVYGGSRCDAPVD